MLALQPRCMLSTRRLAPSICTVRALFQQRVHLTLCLRAAWVCTSWRSIEQARWMRIERSLPRCHALTWRCSGSGVEECNNEDVMSRCCSRRNPGVVAPDFGSFPFRAVQPVARALPSVYSTLILVWARSTSRTSAWPAHFTTNCT